MGGCATKPKVLKEDAAAAPEPAVDEKACAAPEPAENEKESTVVVVSVSEVAEIIKREEEEDKVKEIVGDDKVDDQESKRRSLSHLFKEVMIIVSYFPFILSPIKEKKKVRSDCSSWK